MTAAPLAVSAPDAPRRTVAVTIDDLPFVGYGLPLDATTVVDGVLAHARPAGGAR